MVGPRIALRQKPNTLVRANKQILRAMAHSELSLNAVLKCRYAFARPNSRHSSESAVSAESAVFIVIDYCDWVVRFCACVDSEISCPRYDVLGCQIAVGS